MITWVPWAGITSKHLEWIARSMLVSPEDVRPDEEEFLMDLKLGRKQLFEWPTGMVVVAVRDKRLVLWGFGSDPNLSMETCRLLADDLKRLAADWQCHTIETLCFDSRFTSVIRHLGGRVESTTLVMDVEPQDERK